MLSASSQPYNQSLVGVSRVPPPSPMKVQGWILPQAGFGEAATSVPYPHAPSNRQPISTCYRKHENSRKHAYEQRAHEIEHGSFTPFVLSATGLGNAATICYKKLASMIATKHDQPYSSTMSWLRCTLSFALLRSSIQCIRGSCSAAGHAIKQQLPPIDL